jgi:hypothetical protein
MPQLNSLSTRLAKLRSEVLEFACPGGVQAIIDEGDPVPAGPACRQCGRRHILVIREVIVETRAEAEHVLALNRNLPPETFPADYTSAGSTLSRAERREARRLELFSQKTDGAAVGEHE